MQVFLGETTNGQVIIENAEIKAKGKKLAWIRAFPERPTIRNIDNTVYENLKEISKVDIPHHVVLQEKLLRTSLIGHIYERISRPEQSEDAEVARVFIDLNPNAFMRVQGEVISSTITRQRSFSSSLQQWLDDNEFVLTISQRRSLMLFCEKSWHIVATSIDVSDLTENTVAVINPLIYEFEDKEMQHTTALINGADVDFHYWLAAANPKTPRGLNVQPGAIPANETPAENTFVVSFNQKRPMTELSNTFLSNWDWNNSVNLVTGRARNNAALQGSLTFIDDTELPPLPTQRVPGGLMDLLICLLLGIAPLLFAPESWVLYWLRTQGKLERTRVNPNPVATKIWPLYCMGIGLYWILAMTGVGRLAGVLPFIFGLLSIRTQETPTGRVLTTFKKPKKTMRASKPAK